MSSLLKSILLTSVKKLTFNTESVGWHLLKVSARVKSEKQRGKNQTDDEELIVTIDDRTFSKLNTKQALYNSPAAFNGGKLHNKEKTIYFLLKLNKGEHSITLEPQYGAEVMEVSYKPVHVSDDQIELTINNQAEDRDRKPWMTFVLDGNDIKSITAKIDLQWRWFDGDDVQVVIDGKIKKNTTSLFHKNWIYYARPIIDIGGRAQTETFSIPSDSVGLHYVEFLADRMPILKTVKLLMDEKQVPDIKEYNLGLAGENYNRFNPELINKVSFWNSHFLQGQYPPPPQALDPNLIKAIMYVESEMGFGINSTGHPAYPDVMQIGDEDNPAIHTLNNDGWIDPNTKSVAKEYIWTVNGPQVMDYKGEANVDTVENSIHWSVRWLYHKAEIIQDDGARGWRSWKDAVARYNGGGDFEYIQKVYNVYEKGIGRNSIKLWSIVLLLLSFPMFLSMFVLFYYQNRFFVTIDLIPESKLIYSQDYRFVIHALDGVRLRSFEIGQYAGHGGNIDIFGKNDMPEIEKIGKQPHVDSEILVLSGKNNGLQNVVMLIEYSKGKFKHITNMSENRGISKTFHGDNIFVANRDADSEPEVIEEYFIPYSNAPDEWWVSYFDFDKEIEQYKLTHIDRVRS
ncbi:hypothetical protein COY14_00815 [Candidatus Roizmanbacteria bacterium CG_4_10_14_0_2_um_filter_36_9]|uniref:Uncharacterized protein n=1 Tax=Candidatus Roizmanbacteria bacterium CG_4_10_14_0_2_um_filter_36_9 TaxID=1974823 RepID=A0A2M7U5G4_9BACT|nr:MAG: hypothetical protein COY14_00815 [Candidatus Roizmanbacteria bacterium CG_4_10_14_0_2_um_filter_36_9]